MEHNPFFESQSGLKLLYQVCNENQPDALFILSLFRQSTSTFYGHVWSPTSGGILCVYIYIYIYIHTHTHTTIGTCCAFQLTVCWPANRQSTEGHNTYQLLYIYSIIPDDGLQTCPKHVEVDWRNKLGINSTSSWCTLHGCIEMHGQQNKVLVIKCLCL